MSRSDGRDRPGLTLLVQLFGREVLDRLARAGYDDETVIAAAGADRLCSTSGVSLTLARRIVAVVEEARGASTQEQPGTTPESSPPRREAPREARSRKGGASPPEAKRPRLEPVPAAADPQEPDPFVDDVALVSWMGFTTRSAPGKPSFSVADRILDAVRTDPSSAEEAGPPAPQPDETRPPRVAQDGAPRHTLPGSFWSFGGPIRARSPQAPESSGLPGTKEPREGKTPRRVRDDH